jgi:hypothetical protein
MFVKGFQELFVLSQRDRFFLNSCGAVDVAGLGCCGRQGIQDLGAFPADTLAGPRGRS